MELTDADIFVLSGTLLIPVCAGIYFAIKGKNKFSTDNYYFSGRNASPIPVAASISASAISSITIVAYPAEVYMYGAVHGWYVVGGIIAKLVAAAWFLPIYHKLQLSSLFEYLELRFNKPVRLVCSFLAILGMFLYIGIVIYIPALSLSATTSLSIHVAVAVTSFTCIFYTAIGGMKAVIWTDLLQSLLMIAGSLGLLIKTTILIGGLEELSAAAYRGGRYNIWKFNPDPRIRSSIWTLLIASTVNQCYNNCCNQVYVQRYLSCESTTKARIALLLANIPDVMMTLLGVANGLALYTYFENCDPLTNGQIEKVDQAVPYLALQIFQDTPGMTGLLVGAIFSGTLSTVSSYLNSLSSLILHDFLLPNYPQMTPRTKKITSMILVSSFGAFGTGLAYITSTIDENVAQVVYASIGMLTGPTLGIFTMAVCMPWIDYMGAIFGFVCSWMSVIAVGLFSLLSSEHYSPEENGGILSFSTDSCASENSTEIYDWTELNGTLFTNVTCPSLSTTLFSMSFYLYGALSWLLSLIFGNLLSLCTSTYDPSTTDWRLFIPGIKSCLCREDSTVEEQQLKTIRATDAEVRPLTPGATSPLQMKQHRMTQISSDLNRI